MLRQFETHQRRRGSGRHWLLVGFALVLVLLGHDLVMTGGALAAGSERDSLDSSPPVRIPTGSTGHYHFRADAPEPDNVYLCNAVQSVSTPDRTFPKGSDPAAAFPLATGSRLPLRAFDWRAAPTIPPDIRRALLQVFRI